MIGGSDHVIPFRDTPALRDYLERYARALWPLAVIVRDANEWYVFQDVAAESAWDRDGGTDDNQPLMFSLYFQPDQLTVVTVTGSAIPREIESNLDHNFCFPGFQRTT